MNSERKRPRSVTWLVLGVLTLTVHHATRLVEAFRQWAYINQLPLNVSPWYLIGSGAIWALVGLALSIGLWQGRDWAVKTAFWTADAYTLYIWIDRVWLSSSPLRATNQPFAIGLNIVLLILLYWILSRPTAQTFFGESNE